jgi:hypothetical protein
VALWITPLQEGGVLIRRRLGHADINCIDHVIDVGYALTNLPPTIARGPTREGDGTQ